MNGTNSLTSFIESQSLFSILSLPRFADELQTHLVHGIESGQVVRVHVQDGPEIPLLVEDWHDNFRACGAGACDVSRKVIHVRHKQCFPVQGRKPTDTLGEGNSQTAMRTLIRTDYQNGL